MPVSAWRPQSNLKHTAGENAYPHRVNCERVDLFPAENARVTKLELPIMSKLVINVFGKHGCAKCAMLNRRIDQLIAKAPYDVFDKVYRDVLTEEGLVTFCKAECLNPSRIPAMVVSRREDDGSEHYLENPAPGKADPVCRDSRLFQFVGIQTDYSPEGKGVITPEMVQSVLDEALALA